MFIFVLYTEKVCKDCRGVESGNLGISIKDSNKAYVFKKIYIEYFGSIKLKPYNYFDLGLVIMLWLI